MHVHMSSYFRCVWANTFSSVEIIGEILKIEIEHGHA